MKQKRSKSKFIQSPFLVFGLFLYLVLGFGFGIFVILYPAKPGNELSFFGEIITLFMFFILPIICFVFLLHRGLSVVEFNEIGVKKSLFNKFSKRQIKWEDIKEMRIVYRVSWWLFISEVDMANLSYTRLVKRKDTINCTMSKCLYKAIRQYYDGPILGLSENDIKKLES